MEVPIIICPTQGVISHFLLAMLEVVQKKQWLVKENLLRFTPRARCPGPGDRAYRGDDII
jgi:hypothetical protein